MQNFGARFIHFNDGTNLEDLRQELLSVKSSDGSAVDLSAYAKETEITEVKSEIEAIDVRVKTLETTVSGLSTSTDTTNSVDLSKYATVETVDTIKAEVSTIESNISTLQANIEALKTSVSGISATDLSGVEGEIANLQTAINEIKTNISAISLDGYVKTVEVDSKIADSKTAIETEIATVKASIPVVDLSGCATKEDIATVTASINQLIADLVAGKYNASSVNTTTDTNSSTNTTTNA